MQFDMLFSSRKAKFTAGEVKANGKPVACCTMFDLAMIPTPMMICGAIPIPAAGCGMSVALNSLLVGMHWVDLLAGWVDVVVSMAQGAFMSALSGGMVEEGHFRDGLGIDPIPDFGGLLGGAVRLIGGLTTDYSGDGELSYGPLSGPVGAAEVKFTRDGVTGDETIEVSQEGRLGGLAGFQHQGRHVEHADGRTEQQYTGGTTWLGGGQETTTTGTADGPNVKRSDSSLPWSEGTEVPFL